MANTPQQVMDFLRELARRARPFAERDLAELREFAKAQHGLPNCRRGMWVTSASICASQRYAFPSRR